VVDSAEQRKELAAYLATLAKEARWASYFDLAPIPALDVEVIPMAKLENRLRRVMPAYPVFDGLRVVRARYVYSDNPKDPGQKLVFFSHVVGRPSRDAADRLHALVAEDRDYYARRLPKGRPVEIRTVPLDAPTSDQLGEFSVGYGALALAHGHMDKAKAWLDVGTLHYPHDTSVWFLSAYYNHVNGDAELARRDLYRIVEMEGRLDFDGPTQRKRRYAAAKDLQGPTRDGLEKLWRQCFKEVKDGATPMKLAEKK
jgi:hypothetical protein